MSKNNLNALVLGANGLVGLHTIELLLQSEQFQHVYAVSRRGIDIEHPKLIQIKADVDTIAEKIQSLKIDCLFSCLGSTRKKTPNLKDYYRVDYVYPLLVADILKQNGCETVCLVSALGANAESRNFYMTLKGEAEQDMEKIGFATLHILQPSLIKGKRNESRLAEGLASGLFTIIDPLLIGGWKKYRSIQAKDIASAMVNMVLGEQEGIHRYSTDRIKELA